LCSVQCLRWPSRRPAGAFAYFTPPLTANYIKRSLGRMPKFYGTYDLPSLDNLVSYRFNPRSFSFS